MAAFDQIILPGLYAAYPLDVLSVHLTSQVTRYLFTYGDAEGLYYGLDPGRRMTCAFLESIASTTVSCVVHSGGHVMPKQIVLPFIAQQTRQAAECFGAGLGTNP
jgi:hypothetical protein